MKRAVRTLCLLAVASACAGERPASRGAGDSAPPTPAAQAVPTAAPPAGAYDCHKDPALGRAVTIAPADTAGLGAAIAASFPGYRLTTEREIACRFPLTDGSTPGTYWPAWGSGTAWWIWRGDFDGDGQGDRLVLLTEAADPSKDLLGVVHGNGTAARVVPLGGWGVEVLDAAQARERGVAASVTNAIAVVFWEKASDVFYWNGAAYVLLDAP